MSRHNSEHLLDETKTVQENRGGGGSCLYVDVRQLPVEFYREIMMPLARIAERAGLPRDQCEDMAQEAWLRALEHTDQFPGQHTLAAVFSWLAVIVFNAAVDAKRKQEEHPTQALDDPAKEPMDRKAAARAALVEVREQLTPLLDRLQREKPENYQLVRNHFLEERKVKEIAEETGRPAHEISYRIHRALRKMRGYAPKSDRREQETLGENA